MSTMSRRGFLQNSALVLGGLSLTSLVGCGGQASGGSEGSAPAAAAGAGAKLVEEGKLTCISNMYFPPFEFMDEKTGEAKGFDIELSNAIAEHMGLTANWTSESNQSFDSLVPTIKAGGKADIAIAGMTITEDRKQEVNLSNPYLDSNQSLVIKKGSGETLKTLDSDEKTIAVQAGTTGADWAKENFPKAASAGNIKGLDDIITAMEGVSTGNFNALVTDLPVASYQINENGFDGLEIEEEIPTGEQYGIAVSKDNPQLLDDINAALEAIKQDGTMAKLQKKWFGQEL